MAQANQYILWLESVSQSDAALVGSKNANLGELITHLAPKGIRVPSGFAITTHAYNTFIDQAGIRATIEQLLADVDTSNLEDLAECGHRVREAILRASFPDDLQTAITTAYIELSKRYTVFDVDVAVRSSATAEDLSDASFAGQQESYLNIQGPHDLLETTKQCFASLFTNRAISYRSDNNIDQLDLALAVCVQKMVRSDLASAGVMFTLDPESGFRDAIVINGSWGLGELVVQGKVEPDDYTVFTPTLRSGVQQTADGPGFAHRPIISKQLGSKTSKLVYASDSEVAAGGTVKTVPVIESEQQQFVLRDDEILILAYWGDLIAQHYGIPMDIEWAKDGNSGEIYIIQARPETVQAHADRSQLTTAVLEGDAPVLLAGIAVGSQIGSGRVNVIANPSQLNQFCKGDILVTDITDPDWEPIMKLAAGIITNSGGRTSHAAIIAREMGVPAVVGCRTATDQLSTGQTVTVSCAAGEVGRVYDGAVPFRIDTVALDDIPPIDTKMMLIAADTSRVFQYAQIPNSGVGLARQELIILNHIKIHPLALARFDELVDPVERAKIERFTAAYPSKPQFYVEKLAEGVGKIAAAFYPKDVIVRLSDFRSNEYANLLGGRQFEPHEENPMIGWRGASRYYSPDYAAAFALECQALLRVRRDMGLTNVKLMVPFCRTPEEGRRVLDLMATHGLEQGVDGLEVYVMCELPSNVLLAAEFAELFDGFSIGSNDLTQLILGLDRDSGLVAELYDERNPAVKAMITQAITAAHAAGIPVGICGQGPSDFPDFAEFLVDQGIDSIALNPDSLLKTSLHLANYKSGNSA